MTERLLYKVTMSARQLQTVVVLNFRSTEGFSASLSFQGSKGLQSCPHNSSVCSEEIPAVKAVFVLQRITQLEFPLTGEIAGKTKQCSRCVTGITSADTGVYENQVAS